MGQIYPKYKSRITLDCLLSVTGLKDSCTFMDFGCNKGNLLSFDEFSINPENYTGVDVDTDVLLMGKEEHPNANFIYYDRFSSVYNQSGSGGYKFPEIDKNQDIIFAFSVFTHTDYLEMKRTIEWFKTFNYKKIIISLLDINRNIHLELFYKRRLEQFGYAIDIRNFANSNTDILYYIDSNKVIINDHVLNETASDYLLTFYNLDYIREEFNCTVEIHNDYPFMVIENEKL